jgi:WxL interacting protein linking bacterial and host surfaces
MSISGRRARYSRGSLLATFSLCCGLVAIAAPVAALAAEGQVRLALTPVGQSGSFFDLVMRSGETRNLGVDVANVGDAAIAARTYASDVYTIINGGFGARLREEPQTGMTRWLDYRTEVLVLPAGKRISRSFTVTVPADTTPGEYITSLILENERPIRDDGAVGLDQVVRQAVAVVVTVPGPRSPGLVIGDATHSVVAGRSVIAVAVENTGNVRLKPIVTFMLADTAGTDVSKASIRMDTFYAHTDSFVEVQLARLLMPGRYTVRLALDDADQDVRTDAASIEIVVEAPTETAAREGASAGLTDVIQDGGASPPSAPAWGVVFLGGLLFGSVVIGLVAFTLRRRSSSHRPGEEGR